MGVVHVMEESVPQLTRNVMTP